MCFRKETSILLLPYQLSEALCPGTQEVVPEGTDALTISYSYIQSTAQDLYSISSSGSNHKLIYFSALFTESLP